MHSLTVGGIKLKVPVSEIEKARKILEEYEHSQITDDKGEVIHCPKCQSDKIQTGFKSMKNTKGVLSAIVSFLLLVFPIYYKTVYHCRACGTEFE